jgi:hypothetical protein
MVEPPVVQGAAIANTLSKDGKQTILSVNQTTQKKGFFSCFSCCGSAKEKSKKA